jgi:hypothetical protein
MNQKLVTPALLERLDHTLESFREAMPAIQAMTGYDASYLKQMADDLQAVLSLEREFIANNQADSIREAISHIKNRPIVLGLIAKYVL